MKAGDECFNLAYQTLLIFRRVARIGLICAYVLRRARHKNCTVIAMDLCRCGNCAAPRRWKVRLLLTTENKALDPHPHPHFPHTPHARARAAEAGADLHLRAQVQVRASGGNGLPT
jgi:hypothetical protein